MRVWFQTDRIAARRGQALTLEGFIKNSFDRAVELSYGIESDPQLHWSVLGPSSIEARTTAPITVEVQVPRDLPATHASVPVELVVQLDLTDLQARAGTIIDLADEPRRCAMFPRAPTVKLNSDGTASLTASIVNCGPLDLSVDLRVRHVDGWTFDLDTTDVTLSAGGGPVDVTAVIGRPGKVTIEVGDTLQVEVTADGDVLTSATLSVRPSADSWRQRARRLLGSGLVAVVAVLALAILGPRLFASGEPEVIDENPAATEQRPPSGGGEPPPPVELTVVKSGDGAGTVFGGGIACGSTCTAQFEQGAEVELTAEVADGSVFGGWSGSACDGSSSTSCTVTMDGDKTITVRFNAVVVE